MGEHVKKISDKNRPVCLVCDCRYTCTCHDGQCAPHACNHVHAVHSLYYALPTALDDEPAIWLTGTADDIELEADDDEPIDDPPVQLATITEMPVEEMAAEEMLVEEAPGPSKPSSDQSLAVLTEFLDTYRLKTEQLTFEHLDKIKATTKIVKEAFVPIGEELRLPSFEVNPDHPVRKQKAVKHSHSMGRVVLQKKKKKRHES